MTDNNDVVRPRMIVEKEDGTVLKIPRLWINGRYVRDSGIIFNQKERSDIQASIERIKEKIMSK